VLTIAYLYFKLEMSQLAIVRETGRSLKAVHRVVALFGKAIEAWLHSAEAEGRGLGRRGLRALGNKGRRQTRPRKRGRRRGRGSERKNPFFTFVERCSCRALFLAKSNVSCKTVAGVLLGRVERGNAVYTGEFRGYGRVGELGYVHFSVRHLGGSTLSALCTWTGLRAEAGV